MSGARPFLIGYVLFAVLLLPVLLASPWIPGTDGYYHIRFAELVRQEGFPDSFPWVTQSILERRFSDTAPLYHLLLVPLTFLPLMWGAKVAAWLLTAAVFATFLAYLRWARVPAPAFWAILFLAVGGSLWRYSLPRPHTLSVLMMIIYGWALHHASTVEDPGRRFRLCWIFIPVTALYALAYVGAPQVILGMLGVHVAVRWRRWTGAQGRVVLYSLLGLGLGLVVHPNFPRSIEIAWFQTVEIPLTDWREGEAIRRPTEMAPYGLGLLLVNSAPALIAALGMTALFLRQRPAVSREAMFFVLLAILATPAYLASQRFVEYWAPLTILGCAFLWKDLAGGREDRGRVGSTAWTVGAVLAAASVIGVSISVSRSPDPAPYREATEWLDGNSPEGAVVFTANWSDFPRLFFYSKHNRYLVHMDPLFMRAKKTGVWNLWNRIRFGHSGDPAGLIRHPYKFGSRYVFATEEFPELREQLRSGQVTEYLFET